jgi:hypothetical protein
MDGGSRNYIHDTLTTTINSTTNLLSPKFQKINNVRNEI